MGVNRDRRTEASGIQLDEAVQGIVDIIRGQLGVAHLLQGRLQTSGHCQAHRLPLEVVDGHVAIAVFLGDALVISIWLIITLPMGKAKTPTWQCV